MFASTITTSLGRLHQKCAREDWKRLCADRGISPHGFDDNTEIELRGADIARYRVRDLGASL